MQGLILCMHYRHKNRVAMKNVALAECKNLGAWRELGAHRRVPWLAQAVSCSGLQGLQTQTI